HDYRPMTVIHGSMLSAVNLGCQEINRILERTSKNAVRLGLLINLENAYPSLIKLSKYHSKWFEREE
ncbi:hypothetical protein ACQP3C_30555, partial [Escherichia coli]